MIDQLKTDVVAIGKQMVAYNYSAPTDGNISFKVKDRIFITQSSKAKDLLTEEDMIEVSAEGEVLTKGKKASTELDLHLVVYKERPDIQAVVHAHPPYATAFAVAHIPLDLNSMSEIVSTLGVVPLAEYGTPSTKELPDSLLPFIHKCNAMLLANHGAITYGESLQQAWYGMQRLEHYAKISYFARQLGGEKEISQHNVDKLVEIRKNVYQIESPMFLNSSQEEIHTEREEIKKQILNLMKQL